MTKRLEPFEPSNATRFQDFIDYICPGCSWDEPEETLDQVLNHLSRLMRRCFRTSSITFALAARGMNQKKRSIRTFSMILTRNGRAVLSLRWFKQATATPATGILPTSRAAVRSNRSVASHIARRAARMGRLDDVLGDHSRLCSIQHRAGFHLRKGNAEWPINASA